MPATSVIDALRDCFLFEGFSEGELQSLAQESRIINRLEGEILFHEGDPANYFYVLLSGQIQAFKTSAEGKEMILHLFHSGDIFAEFPIFSGLKSYPASTQCLKDSSVLAINGQGFHTLAFSHPELLLKMLGRLSERLRYFTSLVEDLSLRNVDARLAKYLLTTSQNHLEQTKIEVNKKTLAAILGTVPETLSRTFKKMSAEGIIEVGRDTITICRRQALEDLAGLTDT
jgi:CRP/FNR family transcriptional regulator, dissimilatory nitrate respiration regulator